MAVERDPNYAWVPPLSERWDGTRQPKGTQCGECGMKFEYGKSYGFHCSNTHCPTFWGSVKG